MINSRWLPNNGAIPDVDVWIKPYKIGSKVREREYDLYFSGRDEEQWKEKQRVRGWVYISGNEDDARDLFTQCFGVGEWQKVPGLLATHWIRVPIGASSDVVAAAIGGMVGPYFARTCTASPKDCTGEEGRPLRDAKDIVETLQFCFASRGQVYLDNPVDGRPWAPL